MQFDLRKLIAAKMAIERIWEFPFRSARRREVRLKFRRIVGEIDSLTSERIKINRKWGTRDGLGNIEYGDKLEYVTEMWDDMLSEKFEVEGWEPINLKEFARIDPALSPSEMCLLEEAGIVTEDDEDGEED